MIHPLESLFCPENSTRLYRMTFKDGERYVLTAVAAFGDDDDLQAAGRIVQPVVRRAEAERHFNTGKAMSFALSSVREVADDLTGEVLYSVG